MAKTATAQADTGRDELVPDPQVWKEFSISAMTLWRWNQDPALNFPPPIKIRNRNFRSRRELEAFKERMVRIAFEARGRKAAKGQEAGLKAPPK
jgi:predicted DNA-binding transcriptional regulator AlpA